MYTAINVFIILREAPDFQCFFLTNALIQKYTILTCQENPYVYGVYSIA